MKSVWRFFTSTRLTVVLTILIVVNVFIGSILLSYFSEDLGTIDLNIFFYWLYSKGLNNLGVSWWIFLLLFLLTIFAINTIVCSIDSLITLFKPNQGARMTMIRRLLPQIVHLGFVTALVGHLVSSSFGFRTMNNYLVEGSSTLLPHQKELSLRLNGMDIAMSNDGNMERMDADISLLNGNNVIRDKVVRPNSPLIYKGIAVYLTHHGETPVGMNFDLTGNGVSENVLVMFQNESGATFFKGFRLALDYLIPDFAVDKKGSVYSASREFRNPAQKIEIYNGEKLITEGWVLLNHPNTMPLTFEGYKIVFSGIVYRPYAVLTINKDPGGVIVLSGALIFMIALIGLLFMKGEDMELHSSFKNRVQINSGLK